MTAAERAAAADFLRDSALVAWEPAHRERMTRLIHHLATGSLDASGVRATIGGSTRPSAGEATSPNIAVLKLSGVLTPSTSIFTMLGLGTSLTSFLVDLVRAVESRTVDAIAILVDSPGGLVSMVPETAAALRQARTRKAVAAFVTGLNASAAYWVSANASALYATPSAQIGSIGVYATRVSIVRQLEREGVDVDVIAAGRFKAEGHPATPMTTEERDALQASVDEAYGDFVSDVAAGRRVSVTQVRQGFGEGRVVSAKEARRLGMINSVEMLHETFSRLRSRDGLVALMAADIATVEAERLEADRRARYSVFAPPQTPSASEISEADRRRRFELF